MAGTAVEKRNISKALYGRWGCLCVTIGVGELRSPMADQEWLINALESRHCKFQGEHIFPAINQGQREVWKCRLTKGSAFRGRVVPSRPFTLTIPFFVIYKRIELVQEVARLDKRRIRTQQLRIFLAVCECYFTNEKVSQADRARPQTYSITFLFTAIDYRKMSSKLDPDVLDIDIPILPRVRTVKPPVRDRDASDMDIPILFRNACRIHTQPADMDSGNDVLRVPPNTPVYWSEEMERDYSEKRRREVCTDDEDAWVVLSERGRHFGRVDIDEETA